MRTMNVKQTVDDQQNQLPCYEIRLKGHLDERWVEWFEGMTLTLEENGDTLLIGPVHDQSALHGLLKKVRDIGIPLVSVSPLRHDSSAMHGTEGGNSSEAK